MALNDKKTTTAWAMYDWANSVYSLVITSTIFPIYYNAVTSKAGEGVVHFLGLTLNNSELYSYSISFSFLVLAILVPMLSGIADYSGSKKSFMKFFAWLGSISCMGLSLFTGPNLEYGIACSVLASIGYGGSLVFYNAYLPEIATPDQHDRVSAKGYALGYAGSVLLMIVNLLMVQKPSMFGFPLDAQGSAGTLPSRIVFVTVGLWWIGFAHYTFAHLPKSHAKRSDEHIIKKGFIELKKVWNSLRYLPQTRNFLIAFFFYDMGVQTIMYLAATYGSAELKLPAGTLITSILAIQLVAIAGAYLFAEVSKRKGNIFSLSVMIPVWMLVCISVFFINREDTNVAKEFISVAVVVGLIMGGIQSLSRSTYSKLLPETEDHASYFSFYDVTEKVAIVLGTAIFGLTQQLTHDMRNCVWPLFAAFVIGLLMLRKAKSAKLASIEAA
jgi:UMF1 family MFS transporter